MVSVSPYTKVVLNRQNNIRRDWSTKLYIIQKKDYDFYIVDLFFPQIRHR